MLKGMAPSARELCHDVLTNYETSYAQFKNDVRHENCRQSVELEEKPVDVHFEVEPSLPLIDYGENVQQKNSCTTTETSLQACLSKLVLHVPVYQQSLGQLTKPIVVSILQTIGECYRNRRRMVGANHFRVLMLKMIDLMMLLGGNDLQVIQTRDPIRMAFEKLKDDVEVHTLITEKFLAENLEFPC